MKIRLLKEWTNGETVYPVGQLLKSSDIDGQSLIDKGIAEVYEAKKDDVVEISPVSSGMDKDELAGTIKELMAEINKASVDETKETDEFAKTGGFKNMADFAKHVHKAQDGRSMSDELKKWNSYAKAPSGLGETVDADGGFLVPVEFRNQLMKNSLEASIVEPRSTVIPMSSSSIKIPIVNESTHNGSVYGGVVIYRPAEAAQHTASAPKFGNITLSLHKMVGLCYVTDELLEDSPISLQPLLTTMFSEAIAFQKDDDFINGSGANEALGVINAPCLVTQDEETGQADTTINTENIVNMWSRLRPRSMANAVWLANSDTFPQLATMTLDVGTGGAPVGLVQNVAGSPAMTLMGRPLMLTEHCQTLGQVGDILLCDWRQYLIGQKSSGMETATSIHLRFDYAETAFRFVVRYDGQPWEASPLTPKNSTITLGSFIALAARE